MGHSALRRKQQRRVCPEYDIGASCRTRLRPTRLAGPTADMAAFTWKCGGHDGDPMTDNQGGQLSLIKAS
jgi:hypothetical protein